MNYIDTTSVTNRVKVINSFLSVIIYSATHFKKKMYTLNAPIKLLVDMSLKVSK